VILGIETSCDDTCAAVVTADGQVLSNVVASQGLLHAEYGGVVPEIASRRHLELVDAVLEDALEKAGVDLDAVDRVAVTNGPGLIGALLVGLSAAKGLAAARGLSLTPVDHLLGHVLASTLGDQPIEPPFGVLVASGGHTFLAHVDAPTSYSIIGETLDDAAGEAFDKGARILGLGYPGGPLIQAAAEGRADPGAPADPGDTRAFDFPRSYPGDYDFSFSGLKTSLLYKVRDIGTDRLADLAASYQEAIVDALTTRVRKAITDQRVERFALGGGVAANKPLRERVTELCDELGVRLWIPAFDLCTDNAAMIAGAARFLEPLPYPEYLALDAAARLA
jgi:N6-L-threonylcarbamoyladenine synthase